METKFKRHDKVKLTMNPDPEYIEYHTENQVNPEDEPVIGKGSKGVINLILATGKYHVEIHDEKGEPIAYVAIEEEGLEAD